MTQTHGAKNLLPCKQLYQKLKLLSESGWGEAPGRGRSRVSGGSEGRGKEILCFPSKGTQVKYSS